MLYRALQIHPLHAHLCCLAACAALSLSCTSSNPGFDPALLDGGVIIDLGGGRDGAGGNDGAGPRRDGLPDQGGRADRGTPVNVPKGVDVLVVVDDSPNMGVFQWRLARDIGFLLDELAKLPGGPNFRVGIVSTDAGVGQYVNQSCSADGAGGELQIRDACENQPVGGASYVAQKGNQINVDVSPANALGCLLRLGEEGCGFEQPLESMRKALTGANPNFLRQDAALAVIVLSNEDDCSAAADAVFNPDDESFGPFASFRCFEHGVLCGGNKPARAADLLSGCVPGQKWLWPVDTRYAQPLKALKQDPRWVSVLVLAGPHKEPIEVLSNFDFWEVAPSCTTGAAEGLPGIRLQAFADALGPLSQTEEICQNNYKNALQSFGKHIARAF